MNRFRIKESFDNLIGEIKFIHKNKASFSSCYEKNEKIKIKFKIPRALGVAFFKLEYYNSSYNLIFTEELPVSFSNKGFEYYISEFHHI